LFIIKSFVTCGKMNKVSWLCVYVTVCTILYSRIVLQQISVFYVAIRIASILDHSVLNVWLLNARRFYSYMYGLVSPAGNTRHILPIFYLELTLCRRGAAARPSHFYCIYVGPFPLTDSGRSVVGGSGAVCRNGKSVLWTQIEVTSITNCSTHNTHPPLFCTAV